VPVTGSHAAWIYGLAICSPLAHYVMAFKTLEISVFTGGAGVVDLEEAKG